MLLLCSDIRQNKANIVQRPSVDHRPMKLANFQTINWHETIFDIQPAFGYWRKLSILIYDYVRLQKKQIKD